MKDQKNMYPRKTRHEKSKKIIYEFSYKMGYNQQHKNLIILYKMNTLKQILLIILLGYSLLIKIIVIYKFIYD